ncbi:hypothetical protein LIER_30286 [Lithospermum erythrorhizon]|uniref:Uncharacterized protein n=1 Tax=Lithospermum erythrorhizon TaxID=34254 RepID=A0AAV3RSZ9_LITER
MDIAIIRSLLNCNLTVAELNPIRVICEHEVGPIKGVELSGPASCKGDGSSAPQFSPSFAEKKCIMFDECVFWMHVRGLKVELFTCNVASKLANAFLGCEEVELQKEKGAPSFLE